MQETYGINMRHIEEYGVAHVATLAAQLRNGSRVLGREEPYADWTRTEQEVAEIYNFLALAAYGIGGSKGARPTLLGPANDIPDGKKVGMAVSKAELMELFGKDGRGIV